MTTRNDNVNLRLGDTDTHKSGVSCENANKILSSSQDTHSAISNSSSDLIQFLWQRHLTSREASCNRCHRDATTLYER